MWASFTGMYFQFFIAYILLMHKVVKFINPENVCVLGDVLKKGFLTTRKENKNVFAFVHTCF